MDRVGKILVANGALDEEELQELLELHGQPLPFASYCYLIGAAGEELLVRALSKQAGLPGIVLSRCVVDLSILDLVPREMAMAGPVLPVLADERRVFCAVSRPAETQEILRTISFVTGKPVIPHLALHVELLRLVRTLYAARAAGQDRYVGSLVQQQQLQEGLNIWVVSDVDTVPPGAVEAMAIEGVGEEITMEISEYELARIAERLGAESQEEVGDTTSLPTALTSTESAITGEESETTSPPLSQVRLEPMTDVGPIDLDSPVGADVAKPPGDVPRVLVVDDDFATRNLLVKELAPDGYDLVTAGNGGEALRIIKSSAPDAVITDVMLPQVDGFQVCRSIKNSKKYRHIPVVLMSAVIDSGRVTDDVLKQYGANAYFEKPLNTGKLKATLRALLVQSEHGHVPQDDGSFDSALALYRAGDLEEAVAELRRGLAIDPLSGRHHFVLANLLQKQGQIYEAIDEYETTVELMPDYFPALTRLAYLYYKKGFSAKAIDTWRRSLPHCPDSSLRENIEVFMRKLITELQSVP